MLQEEENVITLSSEKVLVMRDKLEQFKFVQSLIDMADKNEKKNYESYMRALREGLLSGHGGRWIFVQRGRIYNRSFKRPHDIIDYFSKQNDIFKDSIIIYVPPV
jgi:hypothetical protein